MTNLRLYAKGQNCQVRLENVCNHNPETTVLAHFRISGISGMGLKAPDLLGAWACSNCHSYVDTHHDDSTRLSHCKGVLRTIAALIEDGKIKW
jgi:hypothetical protein